MRVTECQSIGGYVTSQRAGALLKVSQSSVLKRIQRGSLPAMRLGEKVWLIKLTDLALAAEDGGEAIKPSVNRGA